MNYDEAEVGKWNKLKDVATPWRSRKAKATSISMFMGIGKEKTVARLLPRRNIEHVVGLVNNISPLEDPQDAYIITNYL